MDLRIGGAEGEAAVEEGGGVGLGGGSEEVEDGGEIGGRGAVAEADEGEDLAVGLEVLPGGGRSAAEDELEAEAAGVPGLVGERRLLVLRVEAAGGGERDRLVPEQHGRVVPHHHRRHLPDRHHRHPDHAARLDARVRLHSPADPTARTVSNGEVR